MKVGYRMKDRKTEWISTCRSSAYYVSAEQKLEYFEEKFELVDKTTETFSSFVGDACLSINDLVAEFNDEIGNITIENEDEIN